MHLEYAKEPRWEDVEHTLINLTIKWSGIDNELPFTASLNDCESHGKAIFQAAKAGQFGVVAEYTA
jgi:hypothetical protein